MGRAKREVPTGKLQLKYPKTNFDKSKEYTLNYYYSYNRKTMTKDTGYRVKVGDWNQAGNNGKGAVRPSYGSDYARVNNRLDDFLREIDEIPFHIIGLEKAFQSDNTYTRKVVGEEELWTLLDVGA